MRVTAFALLSLVLFVAGCALPATTTTGTSSLPVAAPPRFADAVGMPDVGGGEPNLAILPDGTLFVTSPAGAAQKPNVREGSAFLWRSSDGGKTWQTLRSPDVVPTPVEGQRVPGAFCSCDADVTTSSDGWVYYADWWIAGLVGPGNYIVEASHDKGATWTSASVTIPENLVASVDREWLVAGSDGFLGLFYSFFGPTAVGGLPVPAFGLDRPGQAIEAVFSHDHGATWSNPTAVVAANGDSLQIGHPFMAPNGTLMMAYGRVHSPPSGTFWYDPSEVDLAYSTDKGTTWKSMKLADVPLGFDNLWAVQGAVDASTGQSTVVWAGRLDDVADGKAGKESRMGLWVKQFGPQGDFDPVLVRGDGQNFLPWATARDGRAAVGWYGGDARGHMMEAPAGANWFAYAAVAEDGHFTNRTASVPVVEEPVKVGPICPKGSACNGNRELLDYVSLVLDGAGKVHYAYTRSEQGNPHVAVVGQE